MTNYSINFDRSSEVCDPVNVYSIALDAVELVLFIQRPRMRQKANVEVPADTFNIRKYTKQRL